MTKWFNKNLARPKKLNSEVKSYYSKSNHNFLEHSFLALKGQTIPRIEHLTFGHFSFTFENHSFIFSIKNVNKKGFTLSVNNNDIQVSSNDSLENITKNILTLLNKKSGFIENSLDILFQKANATSFYSGEGKILTAILGIALGFILAANTFTLLIIAGAGLLVSGGCWVYEKLNGLFDENYEQCQEDYSYIRSQPDAWKNTNTFSELNKMINLANKKSLSPNQIANFGKDVRISCEDFMEKNLGVTCKSRSARNKTCVAAENYERCIDNIDGFLKNHAINQSQGTKKKIIQPTKPSNEQGRALPK